MNRYKVTKQLGDGTYGSVLKAQNRQTGEIVRTMLGPACVYWRINQYLYIMSPDCNKEDEEEVLQLGRMHPVARSEGTTTTTNCMHDRA